MSSPSNYAEPSEAVAGVVIAGGRSVRFHGEKAAAVLGGKPLLIWAAERLQRSCRWVAVNARAGTEAEALAREYALPVLYEEFGEAPGPLPGIKVGLRWARELGCTSLAISPCDAPLLPDDLFVRLIKAAGVGAAMAETSEGHQPLCSVWPLSSFGAVINALAGGAYPATWMLLEKIGTKRIQFPQPSAFANVNTRSDLAAIAGKLEQEAFDQLHRSSSSGQRSAPAGRGYQR